MKIHVRTESSSTEKLGPHLTIDIFKLNYKGTHVKELEVKLLPPMN